MAANNTQSLKPFRQHAETDVVNLFTLQDDDGDIVASYADLKADGAKMSKGILVSVKGNGWKNSDDPVGKTGIGNPGASYSNTVSFRYGTTAAVEPYKAGEEPLVLPFSTSQKSTRMVKSSSTILVRPLRCRLW